jgi:hypothetical protein
MIMINNGGENLIRNLFFSFNVLSVFRGCGEVCVQGDVLYAFILLRQVASSSFWMWSE